MRAALGFLVLVTAVTSCASSPERPPHDLKALLARMTIEEKVGQMTQLALGAISSTIGNATTQHVLDLEKTRIAMTERGVGSILNTADVAFTLEHWHSVIGAIQNAAARSRLGIPVLYGIDAVHGANYTRHATLFPHQLNLAAAWSPELTEQIGKVTAQDVRASGIPWNFAPVADVARTPLWSRFYETFGEDVLVCSTHTSAMIRGQQSTGAAACLKHFVGYSFPLSGKDRTPAWIPERMLRELFLPPFQAGIAAGAMSVMINSGEVNGIPVHADQTLLTDLLRDELGFEGVAVTDWEDVKKLRDMHRVAASYKEATRMAVEAGIDLCMVPLDYQFTDALIELVKEGTIPESRIDESVMRILKMKRRLGLFDHPGPAFPTASRKLADADALSLRAARESIVLLRNPGTLPLASNARVLVTGPGADSAPMLHGSWTWTWQGTDAAAYPKDAATVLSELRRQLGDRVVHDRTGALDVSDSDVIVVVIGEQPSVEKPGDIEDLTLDPEQTDLVARCVATGKPTVVVMLQGRPRLIPGMDTGTALIHAGLPGPQGARALVEILTGAVNPSARLPFTYPRFSGSLVPYDHKESARGDKDFGTKAFNPLFPFGHGLSYTTFEYQDLAVSADTLTADAPITVSVTVKNTGDRAGFEPVLLFVRDDVATVTPPVQRLRGFRKVHLEPGASRRVNFRISARDLAFVDRTLSWTTEPGTFRARIGGLEVPFRFQ